MLSLEEIKKELKRIGEYSLRQTPQGWYIIVDPNGKPLTVAPTFDDLQALFITEDEVNKAAKAIAKRIEKICGG